MHSYFKKGKDSLLACGQQQQKKSLDSGGCLGVAAATGESCAARMCRRAVGDFYCQCLRSKVDFAKASKKKTSRAAFRVQSREPLNLHVEALGQPVAAAATQLAGKNVGISKVHG